MESRSRLVTGILFAFLFTLHCSLLSFAAEPASIKLPNPRKRRRETPYGSVERQQSTRTFSGEKLPVQTL